MTEPFDRVSSQQEPTAPAEPPSGADITVSGAAPGDGVSASADGHAPHAPAAEAHRHSGPLRVALIAAAVLAGAVLFLSGFSLGARTAATPGTLADQAQLFAPFWDTYDSITRSYVGTVDREKLVQGAIKGMIGALDDPYSSYMSPEELEQARQSVGGEFSGVGAEVAARSTDAAAAACAPLGPTCRMVVTAPIEGSPAQHAGILAGDVIVAVDSTSVDGETLDAATARVRGPKGTAVILTIVRDGGAGFDLRIVRDTIVSRQVYTQDLAEGLVTSIRLAGFSDTAADQFAAAVRAAREKGVTRFIVDLRDNPGGMVTAARSIASQFIATGPIFWEEQADGTRVAADAQPGGAATGADIRVAVLVNRGSASASEIVAGALQDTRRGTLVGETTFGKGTIQEWVDLTAETGGFRLSIAKWLTPDGRWIHGTGLVPDVVIPADGAGTGEPGSTGDPYVDAALDLLDGGAAAGPGARPAGGAGVAATADGTAMLASPGDGRSGR